MPFVCNIRHSNVNVAGPGPPVVAAPLVLSPVHTSGSHEYVVDAVVCVVVLVMVLIV